MHTLLTFIMLLSSAHAFLFGQSLFGGGCSPCYQCNPCSHQWYHKSYYNAPQENSYQSSAVSYNSYQAPSVGYNSYQTQAPAYNFYQTRNPTYNSYRVSTAYGPPPQPEGYARPQTTYAQPMQYQAVGDQYASSVEEPETPQAPAAPTSVQFVATAQDGYAQPPARRRS